jgi:hypothetical protein
MTAADRLDDFLRASGKAQPLTRRRRPPPADLTTAYRAGAQIVAGTAAFPATRRPHEQFPVRCGQCRDTWLFGDSQPEAQTRLRAHERERHL